MKLAYRLSFLVALAGCGSESSPATVSEDEFPQLAAEFFCDRLQDCGCTSLTLNFMSHETCISIQRTAWEDRRAFADEEGLEFSAECAAEYLASDLACKTAEDLLNEPEDGDGSSAACSYYSGTKAVGEACSGNPLVSDCQQGLQCLYDECIDPNEHFNQPDPTEVAEGEDCSDAECAGGLFCNESNTCVALGREGDSCADATQCATRCCQSGVCEDSAPLVCGFGCPDDLVSG